MTREVDNMIAARLLMLTTIRGFLDALPVA
jgi:hypothetical protein